MEPTTFGLTLEQVRRLLKIGAEMKGPPGTREETEARGALLDQWLRRGIPEEVLEGLPDQRQTVGGRLVKDVLLDPGTDRLVFEKLKGAYKEQVAMAGTPAEHDVTTALYYAAIAAGLVYHHGRLSSYSHRDLARSFALLSKKKWMETDLRGLFVKAVQACARGCDPAGGRDHE
jgi:hypothetical protein